MFEPVGFSLPRRGVGTISKPECTDARGVRDLFCAMTMVPTSVFAFRIWFGELREPPRNVRFGNSSPRWLQPATLTDINERSAVLPHTGPSKEEWISLEPLIRVSGAHRLRQRPGRRVITPRDGSSA